MKVSVVCPFYNESAIIEKATQGMIANLGTLGKDWELILVNDGSTDDGPSKLARTLNGSNQARMIGYSHNQGRGYALQTGIAQAKGDLIVTTEADLSWGDRIVHDIVKKFEEEPALDVVVASPNLPEGGYKNVSFKRVVASKVGNLLIRSLFPVNISMNTGMTRGYKRDVIQKLRFEEKGKEFHLEVLLKLSLMDYRIGEVPAVLEWKAHKLSVDGAKRKSSTKVRKLAFSHLRFVVFANPIRYLWALGAFCGVVALALFGLAVRALIVGSVASNFAILSFITGLFSLLFFAFGVITAQNNKILCELWKKQ
jgi:glycosyltransferase involved in cell wall biosynthesis